MVRSGPATYLGAARAYATVRHGTRSRCRVDDEVGVRGPEHPSASPPETTAGPAGTVGRMQIAHVAFRGLALAALAGCGTAPPVPSAPTTAKAVAFSLPSDDGALVTVPVSGARATVLDFFGPTCEPCKAKVPALESRRAELAAKGAKLVLVGVLADGESTADARRALRSWGVIAPFLVDRDGTGRREAGVVSLPATLVLDASGAVTWVAPPSATAQDVLAALP